MFGEELVVRDLPKKRVPVDIESTRMDAPLRRTWLSLDEGKQVRIDDVGIDRQHTVRVALVDFQRAILQELDR